MIIINHTQTGIRLDCECSIANSHQCTGNDEMCYRSTNYLTGKDEPNYPVPAIPTKVEYIFQGWAIDGVFVRVDGYAVAGAYKDGMPLEYMCIPYDFDYPDQD